jgi:hypothetical protein
MNDKAVQTEQEIFKIIEALKGRYHYIQLRKDLKIMIPRVRQSNRRSQYKSYRESSANYYSQQRRVKKQNPSKGDRSYNSNYMRRNRSNYNPQYMHGN